MEPGWIGNRGSAGVEQELEDCPVVVGRAPDDVVQRCLAPIPTVPLDVCLEPPGGHHVGICLDTFDLSVMPDENPTDPVPVEVEVAQLRFVSNLDSRCFRPVVVRIHECLSATKEEMVRARQMEGAAERRLPCRTVCDHPRGKRRGFLEQAAGQYSIGFRARDPGEIGLELVHLVRTGDEPIALRVGIANVSRVPRVPAAHVLRRPLDDHYLAASIAGRQGSAQSGIAATDHNDPSHVCSVYEP